MYTSLAFWTLVLLATAAVRLLPENAVRRRAAILAALGGCGALLVLGLSPWAVLLLAASVAWMSYGIRWARQRTDRASLRYALITVAPVLLLWMLGKHAVAADLPGLKLLYFMGFSYFLVKAWTLIKDCHDGRVSGYDPVVGAAYFFHLPTYPAGPMHYYSEFEQSVRRPQELSAEAIVEAAFRFLWGMLKVSVLAPLFSPMSLLALQGDSAPTLNQLAYGGFVYSIVLYLDFSGYVDMAIATSRLLGVAAPENFRHPYFARNIREFWQRWHITFTRALTAYIFVPLSRALQRKLPQAPRVVMVSGYLVTFGFAGYWHGPTTNFIMWGLYHAGGLIAYDLYARWRLRRRPPPGRAPAGAVTAFAARAGATAATFAFVSFGWILFVFPLNVPLQAMGSR